MRYQEHILNVVVDRYSYLSLSQATWWLHCFAFTCTVSMEQRLPFCCQLSTLDWFVCCQPLHFIVSVLYGMVAQEVECQTWVYSLISSGCSGNKLLNRLITIIIERQPRGRGLIKGTRYQNLSIYAWTVWPGMYTSGRLPGTSFCINIL